MKKYVIVGAILLSLFAGPITYAQTAPGKTVDVRIAELQAQVNKLLAEISRLKGSTDTLKPMPIEYKMTDQVLGEVVTENVKCVFEGTKDGQKCYSPNDSLSIGCGDVGACITEVKAQKGTIMNWKSSCGATASTIVDGFDKYATFVCGEKVLSDVKPNLTTPGKEYSKIVVMTPNGGESLVPGKTARVEWKGGNPNATVQISLVQLNSYNASINHGIPVLTSLTTTKNDGSEEVKIPVSIREGRYFMLVETVRPVGQSEAINMDYSDHQFVVSSKKNASFVVADVNNDGKVNGEDKEIIFDNLGECSKYPSSFIIPQNYCHADLNNNGTVDEKDAEIVNRYIRK
jgi:hypothetical protein